MSRIAIEDLPETTELTVDEQRRVVGGAGRKSSTPTRVGQTQTAASGMFDVASSGAFSVADAGGVQLAAAGTNRFA